MDAKLLHELAVIAAHLAQAGVQSLPHLAATLPHEGATGLAHLVSVISHQEVAQSAQTSGSLCEVAKSLTPSLQDALRLVARDALPAGGEGLHGCTTGHCWWWPS